MTTADPYGTAAATGHAVGELIHTLAAPYDVTQVLDTIATTARHGFSAWSAAVIILDDWTDSQSTASVITSSTRGDAGLDVLLAVTGPGLAAAHTGAITMVDDTEADSSRWSEHSTRARGSHLRATRAFPITALRRTIGAVVVHTEDVWGMRSNRDGQVLADLASLALSMDAPDRRLESVDTTLTTLVVDNRTNAAATGIVAEIRGLTPAAARALIVQLASARTITFTEHCRAIVDAHGRDPSDRDLGGLLDPPAELDLPRSFDS